MWTIILSALMGNLSGIVNGLLGFVGKLSDNDLNKLKTAVGATTTIATADIANEPARLNYFSGFWVTQYLIAAALIPPILHSGAIYLDSVPFLFHSVGSWSVPKAPTPYDDREWLMISALLGISATATTALGFIRAFLRK